MHDAVQFKTMTTKQQVYKESGMRAKPSDTSNPAECVKHSE